MKESGWMGLIPSAVWINGVVLVLGFLCSGGIGLGGSAALRGDFLEYESMTSTRLAL